MKTATNYALWYNEATYKVAKDMWADMMRNMGYRSLWLYFKPFGLAFTFAGEDETPEGFELATGERVPCNLTVEQLTMWVRKNTGRVNVLPV